LIESLILCGVSSAFGLLMTFGFFEVARTSMKSQLSFLQLSEHIQFLRWETVVLIIGSSLILGWIATAVCSRSLNDGWAASQKQKSET
jgi:cell division transport system permease protein